MTSLMSHQALALVGMPGAGKTMCAKYLEQRDFFQFRFGSIVVNEVSRRGWSITPQNERIVREEFRAQDGMDAIAQRALPLLNKQLESDRCIVIDGLYSWSEYRTLRTQLNANLILIAIFTPRHLRYQRLTQRSERPLTFEEAEQRDWQEIENIEKGGPIAIADYTLINDTTSKALLAQMDTLLNNLNFAL